MSARAVCGNVCSDRYAHTYVAKRCNADTHANNASFTHAAASVHALSTYFFLFSYFFFFLDMRSVGTKTGGKA